MQQHYHMKFMKLAVLIFLCYLIVVESWATDPDSRKKILIVGFSHSYFTSNSSESLAKGNSIEQDSVFEFINDKVLETFTDKLNPNFEYVSVKDASDLPAEVQTSIYYLSPSTDSEITSIEINEDAIKKICAFYEADIVMFINSYELNWEEEPYVAYVHRLDSEMFVKSGKRIDEESVSFMTEDVRFKEKYSNKLSRQVSRVLKKLERIDVENDAYVNH